MKTLFLSIVLFLFLSAGYAHAQTQPTQTATQFCTGGSCTYVPLEPLPGLPTSYGPNQGSFPTLIGNAFKLLIGAGAVIAVVMIVLGALTYMFSDIVGNKTKALSRIRNAMWAVVLLVSSYLILVTINPELVKFNLNLNGANNNGAAQNPTGTRIFVNGPSGANIYHSTANSYDQYMNLLDQCQSPKALRAAGNGSDSQGNYTTWVCQ